MDTETRIREMINQLRPYIQGDGGDLQFVDFKDGVVTVSLTGACVGCSMIDVTMNDGIKQYIMDEVQEVKDVVLLQPEPDLSDYEF